VPLLIGVLLAAAWLCYRRLGIAVAVLLPPLCGIAWTGGALAWLGHPLDPIAALLEPVLLTIGVATSVHFVEGFRSHLRTGASRGAAAARAAGELRTPALLAAATTMIGLWSLTTSDIPAVIDFGVRSALGVGLTHLFAFLLLPAWLALVPAPAPRRAARLPRWLLGAAHRRTAVLAGTCGLTALAAAGLGRLRADNDPLRLLPANEPVRAAHERLALRLGGVETFHLLVPATERAVEPERLLPWLAAVRQLPGIAGLAGGVVRGVEGDLAVPLLLHPAGSATRAQLFTSCERLGRVLGFAGAAPAGPAVRIARDSDRLMHGLLGSLALSAALLGAGMAIGLGSAWLGALGLLTNLLPSIWLYGALAWLGQPISVATAMIGCTMLGLIVDNSLHLLHHYRTCRRRHDARGAMRRALARCARPMTLASAVLALGFLTAATSRLATTVEFALLASAKIALAWFGTTIVLPLLLVPRIAGRAEVARAA
jgi:predicted RND superfamily exporter protein